MADRLDKSTGWLVNCADHPAELPLEEGIHRFVRSNQQDGDRTIANVPRITGSTFASGAGRPVGLLAGGSAWFRSIAAGTKCTGRCSSPVTMPAAGEHEPVPPPLDLGHRARRSAGPGRPRC